jgi:hypothetical protein
LRLVGDVPALRCDARVLDVSVASTYDGEVGQYDGEPRLYFGSSSSSSEASLALSVRERLDILEKFES